MLEKRSKRAAPRGFDRVIITCEHATNRVPRAYVSLFAPHVELLKTHRGYDMGAIYMAKLLAEAYGSPLVKAEVSRLVVDLNRSLHHKGVFSELMAPVPPQERAEIVARYYLPYRTQVEALLAREIARGLRVLHVSVHSFTPKLHGEVRNAEIGLLYDPRRAHELAVCGRWISALKAAELGWRIRRNYPYTGYADGFTTYLRKCLPKRAYAGVELEVNQALLATPRDARAVGRELLASLEAL